MKKPLVSVLMSAHNDESHISNAIDSILNQTYSNFEFLIIDDFSQDRTLEILTRYKDNRIQIFKNKENIGLTKSLNILIDHASGDLIARQDSDDQSKKNRFESQINYMIKENLDACTTKAESKQTKKIIPGISFYLNPKLVIKFKNPFIHGSLIIKKEILMKLGKYNSEFYYAQDFKLLSDLQNSNMNIKILNDVLYILNQENNISSHFKEEQKYFKNIVLKDNRRLDNLF